MILNSSTKKIAPILSLFASTAGLSYMSHLRLRMNRISLSLPLPPSLTPYLFLCALTARLCCTNQLPLRKNGISLPPPISLSLPACVSVRAYIQAYAGTRHSCHMSHLPLRKKSLLCVCARARVCICARVSPSMEKATAGTKVISDVARSAWLSLPLCHVCAHARAYLSPNRKYAVSVTRVVSCSARIACVLNVFVGHSFRTPCRALIEVAWPKRAFRKGDAQLHRFDGRHTIRHTRPLRVQAHFSREGMQATR